MRHYAASPGRGPLGYGLKYERITAGAPPMRLSDFSALTFDCYGTLIDWEGGIAAALRPWLAAKGVERTDDDILEAFAHGESTQQRETPAMLYPELLAHTLHRMAARWGFAATAEEAAAFGDSVKDWPSRMRRRRWYA